MRIRKRYQRALAVAVAVLVVLLLAVTLVVSLGDGGSATGPASETKISEAKGRAASKKATAKRKADRPSKNVTRYSWYVGTQRRTAYVSGNEVAVVFRRGADVTPAETAGILKTLGRGAKVVANSGPTAMFVRVATDALATARRLEPVLKRSDDVIALSPVFSADPRDFAQKSALTGQIIIAFTGSRANREVDALAAARGLTRAKRFAFSRRAYLLQARSALGSLEAANRLKGSAGVAYAAPNWLNTRVKRAVPNDTLYSSQWHLNNTGQSGGTAGEDINVESVWDTYKGTTNEVIALVDDGLEIAHEDLTANTALGGHWDWIGNDSNPTPAVDEWHGTACGGLAAARGFNSLGVAGSAPEARLVGYRLLSPTTTDADEAEALTRNSNVVDIESSSWGPEDSRELMGPGPLAEDAIYTGATTGRGGKGLVYVWAGGNGNEVGDNSNFDGYSNSRFTIAVGASDDDGVQSYYSEPGANLAVNAPSSGVASGIVTTDRTGGTGYSSGNYYTDFGGTSASAPMVAGVTALILQANPNLSWRDVQQILMTTATKNDPADADWTTNAAGYHINHLYGFGRVDAAAAVSVATTWAPVGQETSASASTSPGVAIPDNDPTGVSSTLSVGTSLAVEYVDVYFSATDHTWWDDLEVTLTSPAGTESLLANAEFLGSSNGESYNVWRFGSTRHLHENSSGNWTLTVKDLAPIDTGTFEYWRIVVHGTAAPAGTFVIDGGASYATTHTVSLDSTVTNATEMRFRDEGGAWSGWESYAAQKSWTLAAGEGGKTVEAEYRDRLGRTLALSDAIMVDTQGPAGTFVIDEDAAEVATTTVSLDSTVTDAAEMRFKNSPSGSWSAWEAYAQHRAWILPGPDGTKTVEAEYRDVADNILSLSDSIRLETGAPSAPTSVTATAGDQIVDLAWTNPGGDFEFTRVLRSTTGFAAAPSPDGTQTQIHEGTNEALSDAPLINGQRCYYTLFARDVLGNWSDPATVAATPAAPTQTTSTATRASAAYGTRVDISGTLVSGGVTLTARENVTVLRSGDGVTWSTDGTTTWNPATERYEAARTITSKTVFALRFDGEAEYSGSQSTGTTVTCRAYLGRPWLSPYSPLVRRWFYVYGYLRPYHSGSTRLYFWRKVGRTWRYVGYRNATNYWYLGNTRYRLKWRVAYRGWWLVRAYHTDANHLATWSTRRSFYVR